MLDPSCQIMGVNGYGLSEIVNGQNIPAAIASVLCATGAGLFLDAAAKVIYLPFHAD